MAVALAIMQDLTVAQVRLVRCAALVAGRAVERLRVREGQEVQPELAILCFRVLVAVLSMRLAVVAARRTLVVAVRVSVKRQGRLVRLDVLTVVAVAAVRVTVLLVVLVVPVLTGSSLLRFTSDGGNCG
jgi:hypothetical protein